MILRNLVCTPTLAEGLRDHAATIEATAPSKVLPAPCNGRTLGLPGVHQSPGPSSARGSNAAPFVFYNGFWIRPPFRFTYSCYLTRSSACTSALEEIRSPEAGHMGVAHRRAASSVCRRVSYRRERSGDDSDGPVLCVS